MVCSQLLERKLLEINCSNDTLFEIMKLLKPDPNRKQKLTHLYMFVCCYLC